MICYIKFCLPEWQFWQTAAHMTHKSVAKRVSPVLQGKTNTPGRIRTTTATYGFNAHLQTRRHRIRHSCWRFKARADASSTHFSHWWWKRNAGGVAEEDGVGRGPLLSAIVLLGRASRVFLRIETGLEAYGRATTTDVWLKPVGSILSCHDSLWRHTNSG